MAGLDALLSRFRSYNEFRQRRRGETIPEANQISCLMGRANVALDRDFVFVHVPKNGGTTVYRQLGFVQSTHLTTAQYLNFLPAWFVQRAHFFAIYRDPFARFVSLYNFARQEESYYFSATNPESKPYGIHADYETLKDRTLTEAIDLLEAGELKNDRFCNIWRPQVTWLEGFAKVTRFSIVPLGEIDDFLEKHFEIAPATDEKKARLNVSRGASADELTEADRDRLRQYYAEDFALARSLGLDRRDNAIAASGSTTR